MPASVAVRPPNRPSSGAQVIRRIFGTNAKIVRRSPIPRQYRHVINWGNTSPIQAAGTPLYYNRPEKIAAATNKLQAFQVLKEGEVSIPEYKTRLESVPTKEIWLARTMLSASSGRGIEVLRPGATIPHAPLYVQYVRKLREFRIHVVRGQAVFIQEKLRRNDNEQTADQQLIRNYDNGWVFAVSSVSLTDPALQGIIAEAVKAVQVLGLDFGAVDCILRKSDNHPIILEVNTAPGLSSPSLIEAYRTSFTRMVNGHNGQ